jgi:DNA polymerase-3 subunit gamma/tau
MLYAVPSQAEEVEAIGRQLGLQTVLAMVQILDHTAARLRMSLHGRTLVEMAVVRICELENLDDLAALVAELRGEPGSVAPRSAEPAKKNVEPRPLAAAIGNIPPLPTPMPPAEAPASTAATNGATQDADSVLKQFQMAVEAAKSGTVEPQAAAPRVSRRQHAAEQLKEVSERPFVERAIELFDVAPGQFRHTPANDENQ